MERNNKGQFMKGHKSYNYWTGKKLSNSHNKKFQFGRKVIKLKRQCKICRKTFIAHTGHEWICSSKCKKENGRIHARRWTKQINKLNREKVLNYYGPYCKCCKEKHKEFLAVDHKNNDGGEHRRKYKINIYKYIIRNNFPRKFQILCHNCNLAKGFYGKCPHQN